MEAVLRALSAVLCLSQAFLPSCTYASLAFLSEPLSATERLGGMVHLRCSAHPPSARLSWRFRGQPLKDPGSSVAVLLQSPGHLTLPSVQPDQAGDYQCVAESEAGAIASRLARVTIAGISKFDKSHRRSVTVEEGSTALIECHLPPSEPPALPLVWVRGARLDQSTDEFLILPSGNLQIVSATTQHQGMYKCTAYNPITQEFRSEAQRTKLTVKRSSAPSPVRIVYPLTPQTLVVALSGSLTLECVLAGSPPPVARWTKDGEEVVPGPRHTLLYNNLVLTGVRRSDAGSYRCSAQADGGDVISTDYTVSVHEPASVMEGLMDQSVPPGSSVLFSCLADGNPTPNITWLLNSTPVVPSPRLQISGPSLHIADVVLGDQGVYQCLLDNGISSAQSSGILTVQSGLDSEPVILSPPVSGRFQEGDFVSLSCNASGDPLPDIRWYDTTGAVIAHPSHLLQPHKATAEASGDGSAYVAMSRPGSSSLYIQAVAPYHAGKYICMASNKLGSVQAEAFLSVVPPMSTTASVAVSLPSASAYPIQNNVGEESSLPEEELEDLQAMSTERTGYLPTPEAPIITSPPQTYKHDVYDLEWRAGRDWGNPINAYFVKYRKLDDVGNVAGGWHTVRVPGSEKSLHLSELEPSSLYEVLMVARSSAGDGQPAMLTFRTGKERGTSSSKAPPEALPDNTPEQEISNTHQVKQDRVPEAPDRPTISMATESSAYVTWIPRANGGSPITEFRVEFRRQGRSAEWAVAADNISPLKLSVEVRRLEPGSTYRFRVVAMNLYGESPPSAASKAYQVSPVSPPFSTRPVAGPHISTTDAVSDTQIMLRWTYTPSSNNNTPIQGFYIYYRPTDSDNDSDYKRDVVEGNKQWHLIGQLQPETSYDIKMQCFNSGGPSEYSNVMICETKARQALGVAPQNPVASPGPSLSEPSMPPGGLLYLIVGSVLGLMVLILLAFIGMCLWRNRQQGSLSKYDPPGYLCQTAEMNGRALEYGSLRVAGGCMQNGLQPTPSCPHLHHKPPASVALLNGPHTHHSPMEYEHSHAHHLHNGGGMYTALSQSESSDCTSCQNFCNNNRCYTKKNGTFTASTLAIMRYVAPRQPDGLEMVPLAPVMSHCQRPAEDGGGGGAGEPVGDTEGKTVPPPSHLPYRQAGENRHCALEEGALDMVARYGTPERPALC